MILHFVHKKTKQVVELCIQTQDETTKFSMYKVNSIVTNKNELINDDVCKQFPATTGNIITDTLAITKHFKKHGYKVANTITSTKSGIRFS